MPEKGPNPLRHLPVLFALVSFTTTMLLPSYEIGIQRLKAPSFAIPESAEPGSLLAFKDQGEIAKLFINGKPFARIEGKNSYFLAAVPDPKETGSLQAAEVEAWYPPVARTPKNVLRSTFSLRFETPTVPYYIHTLKLVSNEAGLHTDQEDSSHDRTPASVAPSHEGPNLDRQLLSRQDGAPALGCISEPSLAPYQAPIAKMVRARRHARVAPNYLLVAGAPGEVTFAGETMPNQREVLVYHGGGFYSRYRNLKELRVQRGQKITTGKNLALVSFGMQPSHGTTVKSQTYGAWSVYWNQTPVMNSQFLSLSSQLCDSK